MNIYFRMPRVASWTITRKIQHRAIILPHSLRPERVREVWKANPRAFKFTFVRHPYDRFVSAYRWATRKDIDSADHPLDLEQRAAVQAYGSMERFALYLEEFNEFPGAIHFQPQSAYLFEGDEMLIKYFGYYENIEEDFADADQAIGSGATITFGPNRKNPDKTPEPVTVSDRLRAALDYYYADDFRLLGYEKGARRKALAKEEV